MDKRITASDVLRDKIYRIFCATACITFAVAFVLGVYIMAIPYVTVGLTVIQIIILAVAYPGEKKHRALREWKKFRNSNASAPKFPVTDDERTLWEPFLEGELWQLGKQAASAQIEFDNLTRARGKAESDYLEHAHDLALRDTNYFALRQVEGELLQAKIRANNAGARLAQAWNAFVYDCDLLPRITGEFELPREFQDAILDRMKGVVRIDDPRFVYAE